MKIDFKNMETQVLPYFKGGEGDFLVKMFTDGAGKIMRGTLEPGSTIGYHKHEGNCEIIYILSGAGKCLYEDGEEMLAAGDCHYCPCGKSHSLINNGVENLEFFAVVK
ncbi:MAG: cupin domain-containing protein [Clostridia bacterium]|nr:cupin domain-containing protein [Clostridia bacterium]